MKAGAILPVKPKVFRLKFLLGELVLGSWRPRLQVLQQVDADTNHWPPESHELCAMLEPSSDGFLCSGVEAGRFAPGVARYGKLVRYVTHADVNFSVALRGDFADYLKQFSSKSRQNLTRSVRRFAERQLGHPSYEVYTQPEQMAAFHSEALAISRQTYQTRLLDSGLSDGEEFVRHMCELARQGMARGYLLRDGLDAIAFAWCRVQDDRVVYDVIGYLPSAAALSPGTILLYHILEDLFALSRFSLIDFGGGQAHYKAMFATDKRDLADAYFFRPTLKNRLLVRMHWLTFQTSAALGHWLDRLGIKQRVKKALRKLKRA